MGHVCVPRVEGDERVARSLRQHGAEIGADQPPGGGLQYVSSIGLIHSPWPKWRGCRRRDDAILAGLPRTSREEQDALAVALDERWSFQAITVERGDSSADGRFEAMRAHFGTQDRHRGATAGCHMHTLTNSASIEAILT